jgi:hypothetical protein
LGLGQVAVAQRQDAHAVMAVLIGKLIEVMSQLARVAGFSGNSFNRS